MTNEETTTHQHQLTFNFLDAPTGAGKTTAIINKINNEATDSGDFMGPNRFLVVTPYKNEVDRICQATPCVQPDGIKRADLKRLLASGENICCTHALCALLDSDTLDIIENSGYQYHLIIDEEIAVIQDIVGNKRIVNKQTPSLIDRYGRQDFKLAAQDNLIIVDPDTAAITWNSDHTYNSKKYKTDGIYDDLRRRLETTDLYMHGSGVIQLMKRKVWQAFASVTFCSYRMKESYLAYYCRLYSININYQHLENNEIVDGYLSLKPAKLDKIVLSTKHSNQSCTYSKGWYQEHVKTPTNLSEKAKQLRADFRQFRETVVPHEVPKKNYYWTCYKGYETILADQRHLVKSRWHPCNLKATNSLTDRRIIGYFVNRFANVNIKGFLRSRNIPINEQELALSELIQFVWRSNIRTTDSNTVYVFIASGVLLGNFQDWLKE